MSGLLWVNLDLTSPASNFEKCRWRRIIGSTTWKFDDLWRRWSCCVSKRICALTSLIWAAIWFGEFVRRVAGNVISHCNLLDFYLLNLVEAWLSFSVIKQRFALSSMHMRFVHRQSICWLTAITCWGIVD